MNHFQEKKGALWCEDVPLERIANEVGTPCYVYSRATLERHYRVFDDALSDVPHHICYSVKACSNIAILRLLANLGSGFDIVSGGELYRLQAAGIDTRNVVFSGVGKTQEEMQAGLDANILSFNVESLGELEVLNEVALAAGRKAPVSLRINPDIDPKTHPYISTGLYQNKFGIPWEQAMQAYEVAGDLDGLDVMGLDCHIGSQLTKLDPILSTVDRMLELVRRLRSHGYDIHHLDLGGGLGITYADEVPPTPDELAAAVIERTHGYDLTLIFEPGRVIAGNAGVMLTRVLYDKMASGKRFAIVDAAMNDAIRPSLYNAYHEVRPVLAPTTEARRHVDVVGPICESGDFFAKDRMLPPLSRGDLIALMSAGAYGFSMASNYNSRPRVAEVLVSGDRYDIIRQRESLADLFQGEAVPQSLQRD